MSFAVEKVTFFEDRASVCRSHEVDLGPGIHSFTIEGVSPYAVDKSLVFECDDSSVNCVEIHTKRLFKSKDKQFSELKELQEKETELEADLEFNEKSINQQKQFRQELLNKISSDCSRGNASAENWSKTLSKIRKKEEKLLNEIRSLKEEIAQVCEKINQLEIQQKEVKKEYQTEITLSVEIKDIGRFKLSLHYITAGACWRPVYKAFINDSKLKFTQGASLWQNTGEGWNNVNVELSTERQQKAQIPELKGDCLTTQKKASEALVIREELIEESEVIKQTTFKVPGIQDQGTLYSVSLPSKIDIPSQEGSINVDQSSFETDLSSELVSFPEMSTSVNEIVHFNNTSNQPILSAPVNIYKQGVLCGISEVTYTAPGQRVKLDSGNLPEVIIKRFDKSKTESKALSAWTTKTCSVLIHLSNLSSNVQKFTVKERVPVSESDKAKVNIVEKESQPVKFPDDKGIIEWDVSLASHAQKCIKLEYELKTHS